MQISIRAEFYDGTDYQLATQTIELALGGPPDRLEFEGMDFRLIHFYGDKAKYKIVTEDDDVPF